jgi:signal transduction histidine kinase/ActR/RegA family two-component response regulator
VGISLLVITAIGLLAIIYFSLQVESGVRAYVGGEGLYSKGQKDAAYHLIRYAGTRDEAEYQRYLEAIAIPRGDKIARLELEKPDPDLDVAAAGFAQGRNHPADIPVLIATFRVFRQVSYIDQAIAIWTEGDALIDQLVADGDRLHGLITSGTASAAEIDAVVDDVGALNEQLTVLEDRFSAVLGDGARWVRDLLFIVAAAATALLLAIAGAVFIWFVRRIRRSESRYRLLLAAAPDAIVVADRDGRIVLFNEAAERIVGSPAADVIGRPVSSVVELNGATPAGSTVPPDPATPPGPASPSARRPLELQARRADGSRFWAESTVADLGLGPEPGTTVIFRDVSERHAASQALRESQEHLAFALEAGRMGTFEWDLGSGLVRWSDSLEGIIGIPPGSFGGTYDALLELVHPDDRQAIRQALERATATDGDYLVECRMGPPGAQATQIVAQGRVVRDQLGEPVRLVGVALDVTARRELESQLRHAQKMESVGRLAGGIAHDFNNLLTAITGHGDLLAQSVEDDDPLQVDIAAINAAAARAAALTRQLLAYGRQSLLRPEPVDLNVVVSDIEPMLRRLIGEDVELRTELEPDLGWVEADAGQLDQVILNLVVNARDALSSGGTVVLSTENVELDDAYAAEHPGARPGQFVAVSVSDNGFGIDPTTLGRIFEPYFTTKDRGRGTGRGLATVLGIVEQSGGHIDVTSEVGEGTSFHVYLPRQEGPTAGTPVEAPVREAPEGGQETVLLAEDEDSVRRLATMVLERNGYQVIAAPDGRAAIDAATRHDGPIDLLLTDVIMPGLNGRELADQFVALHPEARVLFMSGYAGEALSAQGVLDANVAFLAKPFVPSELARKIREVLDEE